MIALHERLRVDVPEADYRRLGTLQGAAEYLDAATQALAEAAAIEGTRKERAAILIDHYAFLTDRVEGDFFRTIVDCRLELWQQMIGEHIYRICLTFPRTTHDEGDLALIFEADGVDIYTLSFAIGPGSIAGLTACRALYIARVQGKKRRSASDQERQKELSRRFTCGAAACCGRGHRDGIGPQPHDRHRRTQPDLGLR